MLQGFSAIIFVKDLLFLRCCSVPLAGLAQVGCGEFNSATAV